MSLSRPDLLSDRLMSSRLQGPSLFSDPGKLGLSMKVDLSSGSGTHGCSSKHRDTLSAGAMATSSLLLSTKRPCSETTSGKSAATGKTKKVKKEELAGLRPDLRYNPLLLESTLKPSLLREPLTGYDRSFNIPPPQKKQTLTNVGLASSSPVHSSGLFTSGLLSNLMSIHSSTIKTTAPLPRRPAARQQQQQMHVKSKPTRPHSDAKAAAKPLKRKAREMTTKSELLREEEARLLSINKSGFDMPDYDFLQMSMREEVLDEEFMPLEKLPAVLGPDVLTYKRGFINAVSASLIAQPNYKNARDTTRLGLIHLADMVVGYDAEFILKVALYTRNELNIRGTANLLLAYASFRSECRPHLRKYFSTTIRLPSDWIDVAEQYQVFDDKSINFGSLPAALRRVMSAKFPAFDKYQLGKYNKDSSAKKKKKKEGGTGAGRGRGGFRGRAGFFNGRGRGRGRGRGGAGLPEMTTEPMIEDKDESGSDDSEDEWSEDEYREFLDKVELGSDHETEEERERKSFTLKQLIRKLHITNPVEHVMCLIGKKYPEDSDAFYQSRLPGVFDYERAGKRMKLPTPETWETQVSMKGNKATTWQDLIDHKKLPFMAMLRNLRNMIKAGISEKHHSWVLKKLTDEGAVINSRQFPFRFFSAYEVLSSLEKDYEENQKALVDQAVNGVAAVTTTTTRGRGGRGRGGRGGRGRGGRGGRGRRAGLGSGNAVDELLYDTRLLQRYKKALDTSVKIATTHNVTPIKGTTLVFVQIDLVMSMPCTSARGLGPPRKLYEVALLLGLMCKFSCEQCHLVVYGPSGYTTIELETGNILANLVQASKNPKVEKMLTENWAPNAPMEYLKEILVDRTQVDNLIVLGSKTKGLNGFGDMWDTWVRAYRHVVNPNLLRVEVNLSNNFTSVESSPHENENDVYIAGFSDSILRFIAERGGSGQLTHVEKIDKSYNLEAALTNNTSLVATPVTTPAMGLPPVLAIPAYAPRWRTARVFISSTFRDMHGERDMLTRFVFPELRARAKSRFLNIFEVDLRWGITEEETKSNKTVELCLAEVDRCQIFVGILGERYGNVPDLSSLRDVPELEWVRFHQGCSLTELEARRAIMNADEGTITPSFYIRDNSFECDVPWEWQRDFKSENESAKGRLEELKNDIRHENLPLMDRYPCHWGGVSGGKPVLAGLDQLAEAVFENVWLQMELLYPPENGLIDEVSHECGLHEAMMETFKEGFVGREKLLKAVLLKLQQSSGGLVVLTGKPGTGKSALMAAAVHKYVSTPSCSSGLNVLSHFCGAAPGSTNVANLLRRMCHELNRRFSLKATLPEDYKNLPQKFADLLQDGAAACTSPLVVVLDGLDLLEPGHQGRLLGWIPEDIPKNVIILASCQEGTEIHKIIQRRKPDSIVIGSLDVMDKSSVVRSSLARHRKVLDESPFNNQMKLLVSKKEANLPLYLTLACEELRVFGLFDKIVEKLKSLPHTVPLLIQEILTRVESDLGENLVRRALCLLYCSRRGLEEHELRDMLSKWRVVGDSVRAGEILGVANLVVPADKAVPMATYTQLIRSLQGFFRPVSKEDSGLLSLSHSEIQHAIRQRYLHGMQGAQMETHAHTIVAGYFYDKWFSSRHKVARAGSELPYHLTCAGGFCELASLLCSLDFIKAKCALGLGGQLLEDYTAEGVTSRAAEKLREKLLKHKDVQLYRAFVAKHLHILTKHPQLTYQQAMNEPDDSGLADYSVWAGHRGAFLQWLNKPQTESACLQILNNTDKVTTCVAVSGDGRHMACGCEDGDVKIYMIETGKEVFCSNSHTNKINAICFVGKGRLVVASADKSLSLWDVSSGHKIATMNKHNRAVTSVACNKSGDLLASVGWDCMLRLWRGSDGHFDGFIKLPCPVSCVVFHPEGQQVAIGCWDNTIKLFNVLTKQRQAVLRGHQSSVRDIAFNPSGSHIVSAALDGEVKLWSAQTGTQVGTIKGHNRPINSLTFNSQGHQLVTVADDWKVKLWSGTIGQLQESIPNTEKMPVTCVSLHPTGGNLLVAGYNEGQVRAFDVQGGSELWCQTRPHSKCVRFVAFSPDGTQVVTGADDGTAVIRTTTDGKAVTKLNGMTGALMSAVYGKKFLVVTTSDSRFHMFLVQTSNVKALSPVAGASGHAAPITGCAFNDEETRLATVGRDGELNLWEIRTSPLQVKLQHNVRAHSDWINSVAWAGDFVVTASNDFDIKLWVAETGEEKLKFPPQNAIPNHVAYKYGCIVSSYLDGSVCLWSHRGVHITTLHGHKQRANYCDIYVKVKVRQAPAVDISDWGAAFEEETWHEQHAKTRLDRQDAKVEAVIAVSCSDDGLVNVWKPLEAAEMGSLDGHSDRVNSVACSPSGLLVTSSLDKSVRLWQPERAVPSAASSHSGEITRAVTSPSGRYLVTAGRDGWCHLWSKTGNTYEFKGKVQVDEKAVVSVCFMSQEMTFAAASESGKLSTWQIVLRNPDKLSAKKMWRGLSDHPLTSVVWEPLTSQAMKSTVLMATTWTGAMQVWDTKTKNQKLREQSVKCKSLSLCCDVATGTLNFAVSIVGDRKIILWKSEKSNASANLQLDKTMELDVGDQNEWLTSLNVEGVGQFDEILVGSSSGFIVMVNGRLHGSVKQWIHDGQVSAIVRHGEYVITGGGDQTIKVWQQKKDGATNWSLLLVGQFFAQAPVTSLALSRGPGGDVLLISGDELGHVDQFVLHVF